MEDKDCIGAVTMLPPSPSLSTSSAMRAEDPRQSTDSVYKDDDQVSIKSGSFFSKDKNKDGGSGLSLTRHSLTSLSKRRPFSRKPSSWRHPGGTVSETEETDFSECETDTGAENEERRKPSHVHSFTFSSLSRFRSKHHSGQSDTSKKDGSKSPACLSQLSIEGSNDDEKQITLGDSKLENNSLAHKRDCIELPKQITSPSRSPNRKLKEATDKVGDKLRAYAQKFKDNKEKEKGKSEIILPRSSSAGRSDTIEEETFEDVEAERAGVIRAYSLNSKQITKPVLQSHSSTESTDVPTPKSTPSRAKKKLSLKKTKSNETEFQQESKLHVENRVGPHKKSLKGSKSQTGKKDRAGQTAESNSELTELGRAQKIGSDEGEYPPHFSPAESPTRDFPFTFPEVFRQAIEEVDNLTQKCVKEAEMQTNEAESWADSEQENMTDRLDKSSERTSPTLDEKFPQNDSKCVANKEKIIEIEPEEQTTKITDKNLSPTGKANKKWSPVHAEGSGHRSRQGSKRRRKKENSCDNSKNNSTVELKLHIPEANSHLLTGSFSKGPAPPRSASYSALDSDIDKESRSFRSCLSSSPSPSVQQSEKVDEPKSPHIYFLGSSTLPRSTSESRRLENLAESASQPSVLSLQLEGAFGHAMSVCDSNSREDTISPHVSQKTGGGSGESTETLTNVEENLLETNERLIAARDISNDGQIVKNDNKNEESAMESSEMKEFETSESGSSQAIQSCGLLYPELMKDVSKVAELPLTRSATIEQEEKSDMLSETAEAFEGNFDFSQESGLMNEIKIAEIVEMTCEEAEERHSYALYKEGEGEFRAEIIDVGCELDAEVAHLMSKGSETRVSIQAYLPSIYIDWRQEDVNMQGRPYAGRVEQGQSKIKLIVQDFDGTEAANDGELPDLDTFGVEWDENSTTSPAWVREEVTMAEWGREGAPVSREPARRYLGGFMRERDLIPIKDTDSGCSVTSDQVDEEEASEESKAEALKKSPSLAEESPGGGQKRRQEKDQPVLQVAQQKYVEQPRFTDTEVYNAAPSSLYSSTESTTFPISDTVLYSSADQKAFKPSLRPLGPGETIIDWDRLNEGSQANIRFTKSATFPRQSHKMEDGDQALYYPGQNVVLLRDSHELSGGAFQYSPYIGQAYRAYRVTGPDDTDQEDDRISLEDTRTIEDAIKNEAKKLVPGQPSGQKGLYALSEKEFLLPSKVYGSNFPNRGSGCFEMPDGFVTPLRVTPHRNLASSPPVLEDGKNGSQPTGSRIARLPRRHQLRGPFGQMLMEEMAKSDRSKQTPDAAHPESPDCLSLNESPTSSPLLGESCSSPLVQLDLSCVTSVHPVVGPMLINTSCCPMPISSVRPSSTIVSHQRTRSSPSKLEFEQIKKAPELNFAELSGDKLTVAQELLVSRNPRREEGKAVGAGTKPATVGLVATASFRRPKDTRALIVREVFNVEKSYVESLQFLVIKYLNPLKNPENSHIIDNVLVDDIFFQIPNILMHHETFLEDLKRRLESWDMKKTIGDWFLECFTKKSVMDAYTGFIRNVKRADDAIRIARSTKPAFDRFLQDMRRERKGERLSLTDLLAKPHQRIPRYRLLLQRLLEHTDSEHADFPLLRRAEKEIHELALNISTVEKESNEHEVKQQQLRQLEVLIHGLAHNDLVAPARTLLRHDLVTTSSSPWIRKDRCLFLFNDILLITSVSRRGARDIKRTISSSPSNLNAVLEMCRHKLWMYLTLSDVDICKAKEESLKKMMKEYNDIESDLKLLHNISDQSSKLRCPHKELDEALKSLLANLTKQVSDRQVTEPSHASFLQLNINTSDGLESLNVVFDNPEKKTEWEEAFVKAKEKLDENVAAPPPDLLSLIPIRKTRAGLQFTCAAPTIGLNNHNLKDVWVCNSDGYVGQVCVLSLRPEPTVICCNGVCNARILSIVSIPSLPNTKPAPNWSQPPTSNQVDWPANNQWTSSFSCNQVGWTTPPVSQAGWTTPDSSAMDWSGAKAGPPDWTKNWIVGSDGGTAESSPQSGNTGPLDMEEEEESSEEEEEEIVPVVRKQDFLNPEQEPCAVQATMWLGTEDGTIHVYNCTDNIRIKKNKDKFCHSAPVLAILYLNNKVFACLGNGDIVIYSRDSSGVWDKTGFECLAVGTPAFPVTRMVVVGEMLWCGTRNTIKILNPVSKEVEDTIAVGNNENRGILAIVEAGLGVWIAQQGSSSIRLLHSTSHTLLAEISLTAAVSKMLSGCDDIIRQHKTACLRVTALMAVKDMLWVGTSAGVIVTLNLPHITPTTTKLQNTPPLAGNPHGHTGHVRFLTCVEMSADSVPRGPGFTRFTTRKEGVQPGGSNQGRILVISGGDGYEDFSSSANSELAGREDSTNHLLLWTV